MKSKCNVARDLMPLVIDGVASEESQKYVDEHIAECTECAVLYGSMKVELPRISAEKERAEMEKVAKKLRRKRILRAIAAGIAGVLVFVAVYWGVPELMARHDEKQFVEKYVCENGDLKLEALYYDVCQSTNQLQAPVRTDIYSFPGGNPMFELEHKAVAVNGGTGLCVQYRAVYKGTEQQDDPRWTNAVNSWYGRMEEGQWLALASDFRDEEGKLASLPVVRIELHAGDDYVVLWEEGDQLQTAEEAQAKYEQALQKYSE